MCLQQIFKSHTMKKLALYTLLITMSLQFSEAASIQVKSAGINFTFFLTTYKSIYTILPKKTILIHSIFSRKIILRRLFLKLLESMYVQEIPLLLEYSGH